MPVNPAHYGTLTFLDYDKEKASMTFNFPAVTALTLPDFLSDFGALRTAIGGIVRGTIIQDKWVGDETKYAETLPESVEAQRETKWLVVYQDDVTFARYSVTIPTANLSLLQENSPLMIIDAGAGATFVTAFEALVVSPEGNAITVLEVRHVGRNL